MKYLTWPFTYHIIPNTAMCIISIPKIITPSLYTETNKASVHTAVSSKQLYFRLVLQLKPSETRFKATIPGLLMNTGEPAVLS